MEDTIAAIATPHGAGGIGIIRVSGPLSKTVARIIFRPSRGEISFKSHFLQHGHIVSADTGAVCDEVLLSFFERPHSYTGEDTLEINCHGGILIIEKVLTEVIKAGARAATQGEFTRRAFLNNRIDLTQAEAVADLINAKSDKDLEVAFSQMRGNLRSKIEEIHLDLVDVLALIEASIDFSEDETEQEQDIELLDRVRNTSAEMQSLLATYDEGRTYRQGAQVVIAGKPNVGKSSLLNTLLKRKRAIVTDVPGTTRDLIEGQIAVNGILINLTDTAGIRQPGNVIEEAGIGMVWKKLTVADTVIAVLDGSAQLTAEDRHILDAVKNRRTIIAVNKSDLPQIIDSSEIKSLLPTADVEPISISAKSGEGVEELRNLIYDNVVSKTGDGQQSSVIIANSRHKAAIEKACKHVQKALEDIIADCSPELIAFELRDALGGLQDIVGKTTSNDVLDRIFSQFCIGK